MENLKDRLNLSNTFRAMRHHNFRLFFWGQLISVIGVWMQSTAQQWLVYRITGSQTSLGLVTFISFLPVLILSLFMGVIVDRFPRRKILLITQSWYMLGAFILAALTWSGMIQYWQILVLSFMLGIGSALDMPARQAFVTEMVDDDKNDLLNALSLNSSIFNVARIIGPAIGAVIVASLGEAPTFAINGLSYLAVIAALLLMKLNSPHLSESNESNLDQLRKGFQYLASERDILGLVTMVAVYSFVGFGSLTLVPVFAKDILKIGVAGFGQMLSWQGVGALIGGALLIFFVDQFHKGRLLFFSRVLIGPVILGIALSRTPWISMALMTVMGYSLITQLVISNTLIQTIVPDNLRGRVISTYTWALGGFYPLGSLLMGFLGDRIGAPAAAMISGAGCILIIALNQALFPSIHKLN
jgi:MFS family permease